MFAVIFRGGVRWGDVLFNVLLFVSCVFFGVYFGDNGARSWGKLSVGGWRLVW